MPKRLLDRRQPESVREFRAAARHRFDDGLQLASQGRRTGAIYVWGYAAEMALKAAYFAIAMAETDTITWPGSVFPAIQRGRAVHLISWPNRGQGHNVRAWAELLVAERASIANRAFPLDVAQEIQSHGHRVGLLWSETLRYHKNVAYLHEVTQVRQSAEWLFSNLERL